MEFFAAVKCASDPAALKKQLTIARLPELCASVMTVISDEQIHGTIYCLWGQFKINREELKYGIRFSLPDCPNTLAWSVTFDPATENIIIHLTINKKKHDADFIESIEQFINDWSEGIKSQDFNHH